MTRHKVWASRLDISLKNDKCYFFALSLFYCSSSRSRMRSIYIKRQFNSTHMASQFFRRLLLVLLSQTLMAHYSHKCDREGIYTRRISCLACRREAMQILCVKTVWFAQVYTMFCRSEKTVLKKQCMGREQPTRCSSELLSWWQMTVLSPPPFTFLLHCSLETCPTHFSVPRRRLQDLPRVPRFAA